MLNPLFRAAVLILGTCAVLARPSGTQAAIEPTSMRFEWMAEGPAADCGEHCREWIAATGPITNETPRDFDLFTQTRDVRGATIMLDSEGGAVVPSLDLGRRIRGFAMTTTVGRTAKLPAAPGELQRGRLLPDGECASMCAFVLLGGTERRVPSQARVLVHQIWPGAKRYDAGAQSYTAEEIMRIQRDIGQIARYTVEMGADIELFELAMRIPPWERLRALSPAELRRAGLQMIEETAEPPTSGAASVPPVEPRTAGNAPVRGWVAGEEAGIRALTRRHPLTIEGEEIGSFTLTLGCRRPSGDYPIFYSEAGNLVPEPRRLTAVTLVFGPDRLALKLDATTSAALDTQMDAVASGAVSAYVVDVLRRDPNAAFAVATQSADGTLTSIRLGGIGFAAAFPRFAAGCRTEVAHAE